MIIKKQAIIQNMKIKLEKLSYTKHRTIIWCKYIAFELRKTNDIIAMRVSIMN
jgi:uncharacterized membrane protein